jgi:hypothetical protein
VPAIWPESLIPYAPSWPRSVIFVPYNSESEVPVLVAAQPAGFWRAAAVSFMVILVAEFGDLTQVVTAGLAARYHEPVLVGVGAVLALWAVAALAICGWPRAAEGHPAALDHPGRCPLMLGLAALSVAAALA